MINNQQVVGKQLTDFQIDINKTVARDTRQTGVMVHLYKYDKAEKAMQSNPSDGIANPEYLS